VELELQEELELQGELELLEELKIQGELELEELEHQPPTPLAGQCYVLMEQEMEHGMKMVKHRETSECHHHREVMKQLVMGLVKEHVKVGEMILEMEHVNAGKMDTRMAHGKQKEKKMQQE
jgi:hypothetical protein